MKVKTMMIVVAGVALAAIAFTVPAGAETENEFWFDHYMKDYVGNSEDPKEAEPTGTLTLLLGGAEVTCEDITFTGEIYNEERGEGIIESGSVGGPCYTNKSGCEVEASTLTFPWELTLPGGTTVETTNIKVETHFSEGCQKYGLPLHAVVGGIATGRFENENKASKMYFEEAGDLETKPGGVPVTLDGEIEFGTTVTVIP